MLTSCCQPVKAKMTRCCSPLLTRILNEAERGRLVRVLGEAAIRADEASALRSPFGAPFAISPRIGVAQAPTPKRREQGQNTMPMEQWIRRCEALLLLPDISVNNG